MTTIDIRPLTAAIGAEITGLDLRKPLADETVAELRQALLDHLVLFFRAQKLSDDQHVAFALRFGPLSISPLATRYRETPAVTVLDQVNPKGEGADEWHSDNTFMPNPPMGSILRAVELPAVGGDTCFASMYAAYEALSPQMRSLVDGLCAVHDITKPMRDVLLPFLLDHVRSPEFQCRFHWEPDSIAFWDNRAVQHYAVADYTERRVMHRVTVDGPPAR
jgi:taurine dioxygenase